MEVQVSKMEEYTMLLKTWAQNCTTSLYHIMLAKTKLQGQSVVRTKDMDAKKPIIAAIDKIGIVLYVS